MLKSERDALINLMTPEERQTYSHIMTDWRVRRVASANQPIALRQLLDEQPTNIPMPLRQTLRATVERDEMGPTVGAIPPDFTLKQLGSVELVTLSSFRSYQPVALVFGSYT